MITIARIFLAIGLLINGDCLHAKGGAKYAEAGYVVAQAAAGSDTSVYGFSGFKTKLGWMPHVFGKKWMLGLGLDTDIYRLTNNFQELHWDTNTAGIEQLDVWTVGGSLHLLKTTKKRLYFGLTAEGGIGKAVFSQNGHSPKSQMYQSAVSYGGSVTLGWAFKKRLKKWGMYLKTHAAMIQLSGGVKSNDRAAADVLIQNGSVSFGLIRRTK